MDLFWGWKSGPFQVLSHLSGVNQKEIIYSEDGVFFELNIRKGWKMNNKAD